MTIRFFGIDGEMTATEKPNKRLCQIGVAAGTHPDLVFRSDIGWGPDDYDTEDKALEVNKFTPERIESGPSMYEVDEALEKWLINHGADTEARGRSIAVGWSVGSFDMPFVRRTLPRAAALISRRYVDLNGLILSLHEISPVRWKTWKKWSKNYAKERLDDLGMEVDWHDAGYDAIASLLEWEYLKKVMARQIPGPDGRLL